MTKLYVDEQSNNAINYVKDIAQLVENGEIEALNAFLFLKELEIKSKEYKKRIEEIAIDELSKHNGSTEMNGYTISLKKSAGRWDFKHIQEIVDAENNLKQLKEKYKLAYKQQNNNITAIGDGGEVIDPAKFNHGKEIIQIKKQ
jgi:uncharacterized protein (UPF0210 family)